MNEMLINAIDCLKNTKLTKSYDNKTSISFGKCEGEPLTLALKGSFTVNAIETLAAIAVASTVYVGMLAIKKLKK